VRPLFAVRFSLFARKVGLTAENAEDWVNSRSGLLRVLGDLRGEIFIF